MIAQRIKNHANHDLALDHGSHRDRKGRKTVDVIRRAVERIDHPTDRLAEQLADGTGILFAQKSVIGKVLGDDAGDGALRGDVRIGDQIGRRLLARGKLAPPLDELLATRTGGQQSRAIRAISSGSTQVIE